MDFKWIIRHYIFAEKNGLKSIFSPLLLSERNTGIDYIYNSIDYENPL